MIICYKNRNSLVLTYLFQIKFYVNCFALWKLRYIDRQNSKARLCLVGIKSDDTLGNPTTEQNSQESVPTHKFLLVCDKIVWHRSNTPNPANPTFWEDIFRSYAVQYKYDK